MKYAHSGKARPTPYMIGPDQQWYIAIFTCFYSTLNSPRKMRRFDQRDSYELNDNLTDQNIPVDDATVSLTFPEGGREAWLCLLGSFLLMFSSLGLQTSGKEAA